MEEAATEYGIKLLKTPPYHPQANPVERVNRSIKTMMTAFVGENHKKWDQNIVQFRFALNTAVHASTKFSPANLLLGRELPMPNALSASDEGGQPLAERSPQEWRGRLAKLDEVRELVRQNLKKAHQQQASRYDLRRRPQEFKVGEQVLRKNYVLSSKEAGFSSKLAPRFIGPFRVSKVLSPRVFVLESLDGVPAGKWHTKDLKPWRVPQAEGED